MNQLCIHIKDGIKTEIVEIDITKDKSILNMDVLDLNFTNVIIKVFSQESDVKYIILDADLSIDELFLHNLSKRYRSVVEKSIEQGFRISDFAILSTVYRAIIAVTEIFREG